MADNNQKLDNSKKTYHCAHCNTEVNPALSIHDKELDKYFCCDGCASVYHLINDEGFGSYYNKRTEVNETPVEKISADEEYFDTSIEELKNGDLELSVVITGIKCAACVWLIESSAQKDTRIKSFRINYANHKAKIVFDPKKISVNEVLEKITRLGYCPLPSSNVESVHDKERKDLFYRFMVGVFFSMQVMMYQFANYAGYFNGMDEKLYLLFQLLAWALATPVLIYSAYPFFSKAWAALKRFHFTMDTLVALGAGTAYFYSVVAIFLGYETYFDTAVMIITLILLGRFIEAGAKQRGGNTVSKLLSLKPKNVKILDPENEEETVIIPIDQLQVGNKFLIEDSSNIASDGKIISGICEVDESMLTGEAIPVQKKQGDEVFAGTKVISGEAVAITTKVGVDTFLQKIAASVDDAQSSKAPIQDVADGFIGKFVPFVLLVAISTFLYYYFFAQINLEVAIMRAVSVLVIACPCAMGLATPLAIISAATKLSEIGVVFKNGEAIERFSKVNDFYFDKTGTITKGEMTVSDYKIISEDNNAINMISSVAFASKHPASKAIALLNKGLINNDNFEEIPGKGIKALNSNKEIIIGSIKFMEDNGLTIKEEYRDFIDKNLLHGRTLVFAGIDHELAAIFSISDTIRNEAKDSIEELISNGNSVTIITGDNKQAAENILHNANINCNLMSEVSPFDKGNIISNSKDPKKTCMVGDGINDAIALTGASVGISMRNSTDISIESASAVLLRNDLNIINKAHKVCFKTLRIIKENLFWAFNYNIIAIPLAVTGLIHPVMSAFFMSFSSIFVVLNSLRIKK